MNNSAISRLGRNPGMFKIKGPKPQTVLITCKNIILAGIALMQCNIIASDGLENVYCKRMYLKKF